MKILLAIDDSKFSEAATQAVIAQARPQEAEVRILHVTEPILPVYEARAGGYVVDWEAVTQEQRAEAESLVRRTAKMLRDAGFQATTAVESGAAKSVIIDSATQWPADLIVMGSHGRKGIDRFLMGSVAEAVVRHAPCSVEIIRSASANQSAEEHAGLGHSEKCGHPPCTCTPKSGKYCSAQCEAMSETPDIDCRCGHPGCKGRAH